MVAWSFVAAAGFVAQGAANAASGEDDPARGTSSDAGALFIAGPSTQSHTGESANTPDAGEHKEESSIVPTLDVEAGIGPFYDGDPTTLGIGLGWREVGDATTGVLPSARFVMLTTALVHTRDERGAGGTTVLWGGAPLFADFDLYWPIGRVFRLGFGTRAGLYVAPRLYPLFALGAGIAADAGAQRFALTAQIQPLPAGTASASGEQVWTRPRWFVIPTLHVSFPLGKL